MNYSQCLEYLYNRNQFAIKLGLDTMHSLCEDMGRPQDLPCIHVAGTNGKGSVCHNVATILSCSGYKKVGLYTSPHLVSFRERIRINGKPVEKQWIVEWFKKFLPLLQKHNPTYFECVTAMAFQYFKEEKCDICILETGLGGRLDATNVVRPLATAVTRVGMDHTDILGSTIEEIWKEKLGILKPGVPVVINENRTSLLEILEVESRKKRITVHTIHREKLPASCKGDWAPSFEYKGLYANYQLASELRESNHQWENLFQSLLISEIVLGKEIPQTSALVNKLKICLPLARNQVLKASGYREIVLDAGHNMDSIECLAGFWKEKFAGLRPEIWFGSMKDKDYEGELKILTSFAESIRFFPLEKFSRSLSWEDFVACMQKIAPEQSISVASGKDFEPEANLKIKPANATVPVIICGSHYLAGEILLHIWKLYPQLNSIRELVDES